MSFFMLFDGKHTWGFMILVNKRKGLTGVVRKKEKKKQKLYVHGLLEQYCEQYHKREKREKRIQEK